MRQYQGKQINLGKLWKGRGEELRLSRCHKQPSRFYLREGCEGVCLSETCLLTGNPPDSFPWLMQPWAFLTRGIRLYSPLVGIPSQNEAGSWQGNWLFLGLISLLCGCTWHTRPRTGGEVPGQEGSGAGWKEAHRRQQRLHQGCCLLGLPWRPVDGSCRLTRVSREKTHPWLFLLLRKWRKCQSPQRPWWNTQLSCKGSSSQVWMNMTVHSLGTGCLCVIYLLHLSHPASLNGENLAFLVWNWRVCHEEDVVVHSPLWSWTCYQSHLGFGCFL